MSKKDAFKLPPEVVQRLSQRSDAKGLAQLAAHLGLLALAAAGPKVNEAAIGAGFSSMTMVILRILASGLALTEIGTTAASSAR